MSPPILVLGSINIDLVVRAPRLPRPGETVGDGLFFRSLGGKGANQAVAAARACRTRGSGWGYPADVALLAAVGSDDFGRLVRKTLRLDNLHLGHVRIIDDTATGIALIVVDDAGENQIAVAGGANQKLLAADIDGLPDELFSQCKIFLACLESPLATVTAALRRALAAGATTILNPAPACASLAESGLFALIDIVTPNAQEAEALAGIPVRDVGSASDAGNMLISQGCEAAIVTLGAHGAVVVESGGVTHVAAPHVHAVDTTAAGDAFNGALAVALWEGRTLVEAARFACRAAAVSVTRLGAQASLPARAEIDRE